MKYKCFKNVSEEICIVIGDSFELEISHSADGEDIPLDVEEFDVSIFTLTQKDEFTLLWSATPEETFKNRYNSGTYNITRFFEGVTSTFLTGTIKFISK